MAHIGRLHPLLVHFPIALVIVALVAECAATLGGGWRWRTVAVANLRAGAAFAVIAAFTGWRLASAPGAEVTAVVEWHRWLGTIGAGAAVAAALATDGIERRTSFGRWVYRITLFCASALVAATGHLGGILVWGADFLRP